MRILVVEDDPMIGKSLVRGLSDEGYTVDWVRDGEHAEIALLDPANEYLLALVDWGLPRRSGVDVIRAIRRRGNAVPILIITAREELQDRVEGLDLGADDFLVKPFELAELKARMRAVLRRHAGRAESVLTTAFLRLDPATRTVTRDDRRIQLTAREYALLHALMLRPGALLSRAQIEAKLYGWENDIGSNAVEFLLHGLRQKIGADQIENVHGVGWRIAVGK